MTDTVRLTSDLIALLSDSAAAHSTNRQLIRDIVKSFDVVRGAVRTVKDAPYFAVGDGSADDTVALNAAAPAIASGRCVIPRGTYKITDTVVFATDRINVQGEGQQATIIKNAITTPGKPAFHFTKPTAAILVQPSMRGISFDAAGNTTAGKVAVRSTDAEEVIFDDFAVSNWTSPGKDCIGLQLRGRQTHSISNYVINADLPISIEDNPNSSIDCDHYHFWNGYTIADPTQPNIKVASGVNITNLTIDGYQAWVIGSDGFYWVDTTSSQSSLNIAIKNVRFEQSTNPTGQIIRIEHNTGVSNLTLENCYGGLNTLGYKLRKINWATLRNCLSINTSGAALDVDSTVQPLMLDNCFFQTGSTVSVGTLKKVYEAPRGNAGGSIGSRVLYALPTTIIAVHSDYPVFGSSATVAQDATVSIGQAPNTTGYVDIITSEHVVASFALTGATHTVSERDDAFGFFSNTKDTASSYNVYYDAGSDSYVIQNKRTGSKVISWFIRGDNI